MRARAARQRLARTHDRHAPRRGPPPARPARRRGGGLDPRQRRLPAPPAAPPVPPHRRLEPPLVRRSSPPPPSSSDGWSPPPPPPASPRPAPVVSTKCGRSTGRPSRSARSCAIQSLALIPPSIRSSRQAAPSAAKAAARSWSGAPSPPARRGRGGPCRSRKLSPVIARAHRPPVRRAEAGQRGHDHHPAAVGHRAGQRLGFRRVPTIRPSESRSHWIRLPATNTEPSSA
jgi:hypothetical protein